MRHATKTQLDTPLPSPLSLIIHFFRINSFSSPEKSMINSPHIHHKQNYKLFAHHKILIRQSRKQFTTHFCFLRSRNFTSKARQNDFYDSSIDKVEDTTIWELHRSMICKFCVENVMILSASRHLECDLDCHPLSPCSSKQRLDLIYE